jgi:galactose-6-phosphate isomerase
VAFLDVCTDTLLDPDFTDRVVVTRRRDVVGSNGRTTPTKVFEQAIHAVVTMANSAQLERVPDDQRTNRVISVVTKFPMQGETLGKQPDTLTWRGDTYIISAIDYYPQFGPGFVEAICTSMDLADSNLEEVPSLVFNQPQNAMNLGVL